MSSSKIIPISELTPGMMVLQITAQNGPVRIKKSGIIPSYDMVKGLTEMGVQELEIDLENSLDIAQTGTASPTTGTAPKTQTQQLFMQDQQRDVESSMSEQFNRSLFLPSLQALPSQWEVLSKKVGLFVLTIFLGGVLGYGAARGLAQLNAATDVAVSTQTSEGLISETAEEQSLLAVQTATVAQQISNQAADDISLQKNAPTTGQPLPQTQVLGLPQDRTQTASQIPTETTESNATANIGYPPNENMDVQAPSATQENATNSFTNEIEEGVVLNAREANNVTVSPEVAARLNKVLEDLGEPVLSDSNTDVDTLDRTGSTEQNLPTTQAPSANDTSVTVRDNVLRIDQLPASTLSRLPAMVFAAHMYSSNDADRWVRVNNRRLSEGDNIDSNVQIIKIEPQHVVLSFQGTEFRMNALSDW